MIGWLFIAATLFLTGIYFTALNLMYGNASIASTLSSVAFLFIITIPLLSMRIIAEERKQKTDQLVLTAPISVGKIVLGKYLAMLIIFAIPVAVIATFPLILSAFGTIPYGQSYTALLGYLLYGMACLAIGLFISSITESQVIAAVLSFAVLFVGFLMQGITSLISSTGNLITKILGVFDMNTRFNNLTSGNMDLTAVIYFLSVTAVFLFLTVQSIQKRRFSISSKTISIGAYSTGLIAVVLAVAVFVNMIVSTLPTKYTSFDVTSEKLYSLTDTSVELAKNLSEDITIYVLQSEASQDKVLAETLKKYQELSNHIKIVYKDPVTNPTFFKEYTSDDISLNTLIVESAKRFKVVNYSDIYATEVNYQTYQSETTGYDGEGQITSALSYVTTDNMPKAYSIEGHDEMTLETAFENGIEKENVSLESINLMNYDAIPEDAQFVLINAPTKDFSADDAKKVIDYINGGGKLFVTTTYAEDVTNNMPNFASILNCFGVSMGNGLIVEGDAKFYYQQPTYLLPDVASDSLTDGIYGQKYVFMPYAQGINVQETDGVEVTTLLTTSAASYAKVNAADATSLEKSADDTVGPFVVGIRATKTVDSKTASLILYSSENLFTESANQMVADANLTLFTNSVGSVVSEQAGSISVPVKSYADATITVSQSTALWIGGLFTILIPLGMLIAGFIIWMKRRKR